MDHSPTTIQTSKTGRVIIAGDDKGHVYVSTDYGTSFKKTKPFFISENDGYANLYGVAMSASGEEIIAGTAYYKNFYSTDYGATWEYQESSKNCGIMASTDDLQSVACVGGATGKSRDVYLSQDKGATWTTTNFGRRRWTGLIGHKSDFSRIMGVEYYGYAKQNRK